MKSKLIFVALILVLYYFNFIGRAYGLYLNFVITGIINFIITYYLLKTNPFKKKGLFFLFFPFFLLTFTICYGFYMKLTMPGILDYIMYLVSTSFGILIYKCLNKKIVIIFYTIIYSLLVYNYSNLIEIYYSTKEENINVNKVLPILNLEDKNGKKTIFNNENKVLVIDLWSLSCVNCIKSFPKFEKVKNDFKNDKDVGFFSINIYQSKDEILKSEKIINKYSFSNFYSDKSLFNILNFNSVPNYMIVGKDRKIKYFGNLNVESYEDYNNIYKLIENEK
jgi:thiol-disulfide isomerase/thioredoxin